jgi:hypothetical protein
MVTNKKLHIIDSTSNNWDIIDSIVYTKNTKKKKFDIKINYI